jgi:predicted dehydrogenase
MSEQKNSSNRRSFLKQSSVFMGLSAVSYRALAGNSPNERINVGFIGLGGMGTGRLQGFLRHDDVNAAALCDVDSRHLAKAQDEVEKRRDVRPQGYHDFRELLERNDLDAVMIATPDHWHALPTVLACEAGKDVFVEKPLSYSIGEGRAMVEAANRNKRVTQMGIHIHNEGDNYRRVVELVRSGKLGDIRRVHCWKTSASKGIGNPPNGKPPEELDYAFWQGPAPKHEYNPNRSHFHFRYFWDYSGGNFIDFWCHITDVAYWALELTAPKSISAVGGKYFLKDNSETPDSLDVLYEYPKNLIMAWTVHPAGAPGYQDMGSIGCVFQGTEATLVTNYSKHKVFVEGKESPDFPRPPRSIPDSPGHIREFLDCIKTREQPTCNVNYGHKLNKGGLLGNIAYRTGERIYWDDEKEQVINNAKANDMVMRKYAEPWDKYL